MWESFYLSHTSLPVSSDLSYHNKCENAKNNKSKKRKVLFLQHSIKNIMQIPHSKLGQVVHSDCDTCEIVLLLSNVLWSTTRRSSDKSYLVQISLNIIFMIFTVIVKMLVFEWSDCRPLTILLIYVLTVKGLLHPKMKILSLITYPYVVPNPWKLSSSSEHDLRYFRWKPGGLWLSHWLPSK